MILLSFFFFLFGVTGIVGFLALRKSRKSGADYFLASQSISPYFLALSSSASKFSGFMFIGFMGAAYLKGLLAVWLGVGLLLGALLVYAPVVFQLQKINVGGWALSVGELVTFWRGENRIWLRRLVGALTLFFFIIYAAAQLKSGGKIFEAVFNQPNYVGVFLSTMIILFYCWSGGIRASIWTDAAQVVMMTLSLLLILVMTIAKEGGITHFIARFVETASSPEQITFFPQNVSFGGTFGWLLFFLGAVAIGASTLGNPHIVIRAMALAKPEDAKKFIITNYIFEVFFVFLIISVGLCTRVILKDLAVPFDPEQSLILSSKEILPPIAIGFFLAGAFSSALSTADSQIISCSSSLMRDLPEPPKDSYFLAKLGTVCVTILATIVALFAQGNVFSLVEFAFTGLGASIGSVLVLRLLNINISEWGAILVAISGGATVVAWGFLGWNHYINKGLAGFIIAFLTFVIVKIYLKFKGKK